MNQGVAQAAPATPISLLTMPAFRSATRCPLRGAAKAAPLALLLSLAAHAQTERPPNDNWREPTAFVEAPVALPTGLRTSALVPVPFPGSELRLGIDPDSLSVGPDGVIRYVMVATSASGTVNAIFEGVRCETSEVKVYARHVPNLGWKASTGATWQKVNLGAAQRATLAIVRNGLCSKDGRPRTAAEIVVDLREGSTERALR